MGIRRRSWKCQAGAGKWKSKFDSENKKMQKKFDGFEEANLDMVAAASELRKKYEVLYRQLRGMVYPKSKGDLGEEKDE